MRDVLVVRFWTVVVFLLNLIPFGPRYDLEIVEVELDA